MKPGVYTWWRGSAEMRKKGSGGFGLCSSSSLGTRIWHKAIWWMLQIIAELCYSPASNRAREDVEMMMERQAVSRVKWRDMRFVPGFDSRVHSEILHAKELKMNPEKENLRQRCSEWCLQSQARVSKKRRHFLWIFHRCSSSESESLGFLSRNQQRWRMEKSVQLLHCQWPSADHNLKNSVVGPKDDGSGSGANNFATDVFQRIKKKKKRLNTFSWEWLTFKSVSSNYCGITNSLDGCQYF